MRCECSFCRGSGEITCPECDGKGVYIGSIESLKLERSFKNYDELIEFQKDAKRVILQAERLKAMKPERAESYNEQLRGALIIINWQAESVQSKEDLPVSSRGKR